MRKTSCEEVRRELDEVMLGDECSATAAQHLVACPACREFEQKQTSLRQMVGSLETVEAPADFDFRLRARLANESAGNGAYHLRSTNWSLVRTAALSVAALLFFATGLLVVRQFDGPNGSTQQAEQPKQTIPQPPPPQAPKEKEAQATVTKTDAKQQQPAPVRISVPKPKRVVADDFSKDVAPVYRTGSVAASNTIFPIDASVPSLTLSLDDGRGNARTISLPRVTFGSQRMMATGNQVDTKGIW